MPLNDGETFAGFRIVRLLGSGGMGEVYLAQHPRLPRRNALKVLPRDVSADAEYRARFNREADLASTLWHPHIVSVHDRGEYNGQLWISMDFVDGQDAARLLADRYPAGMPLEQVVPIVKAVASALDYAHKQGMLHRDVKPGNIMLSHGDGDDEQRILLADFGIARDIDDISGLTTTNMAVGTVAYSAPEQLMGEEIDGRADQYALAATAYHLLTGSQLFPHSNPAVVISRHLNSPPPALADRRPELAALDPIMSVALAKDPNDRFQRCADFARELTDLNGSLRSGFSALAATRPAPVQKPPTAGIAKRSSRPWLVPAVVGVVLVAGVSGVLAWHPWSRNTSSTAVATSTSPAPPPANSTTTSTKPALPAVFPASAIETLMLTSAEIRSNTNGEFHGPTPGTDMVMSDSSFGTYDKADYITPANCIGVVFGADNSVYKGTGFEAIRDQTFDPSRYMLNDTFEQTAVVFPTADQARAVLASQTKQWQTCASGYAYPQDPKYQLSQSHSEGAFRWVLSPVVVADDLITLKMGGVDVMGPDGNHQACQQALGRRANVIVKTKTCKRIVGVDLMWADPSAAGNYAEELANVILKRVTV
jgi:serine/threonine protein kinase